MILPAQGEWNVGSAGAAETLAKVRTLLADFVPSPNEAQTEADLIRPLLALLGHDPEVQPALKTPDGTKRPDYIVYRSPARRTEHERLTGRIVALETELNDRVYRLFALTPEAIRTIEETTKYPYGQV